MIVLPRIFRIFVALVVMLLLPELVSGAEVCVVVSCGAELTADSADAADAADADQVISVSTPALFAAPSTPIASNITPLVRTLTHAERTSAHKVEHSRVVGAIDSATAAARYGLYNHKILFVSLSRLHYLNRLMRLII